MNAQVSDQLDKTSGMRSGAVWGVLIIALFGVILGFWFHRGFVAGFGTLAEVWLFGMTMCWPMAFDHIPAGTDAQPNIDVVPCRCRAPGGWIEAAHTV